VIPRHELPRLLRAAGLTSETREFPDAATVQRLTVRECEPLPFISGPHRKVVYPDGRVEGPVPIADRPALSAFVAASFATLGVTEVLATIEDGALWLNSRAQSRYLEDVPDARYVAHFLRRRGLTDRFRGGFVVPAADFEATLPVLAAQTFSGGSNVLFASLSALLPLTVLSCHHFDLHLTSPNADLISHLSTLAAERGLQPETLALLDFPE
jgi:hypothetical protein